MKQGTWRVVGLVLAGTLGLGGCAGPTRTGAEGSSTTRKAREAEERLAEHTEERERTGDEKAEREAFARRAIKALRAAGEKRDIQYDATGFLLRIGSKGKDPGETVFLGNFFDEYRALAPEQREAVFAQLSRMQDRPTLPRSFAEARPNLLPVVRGRTFFEQLSLVVKDSAGRPAPVVWKAVGPFLGAGLAFDGPDTLQYLGFEELERWGLSFDGAFKVALENLRQRSTEALDQLAPGTCMAPWEDNYASSRLLLVEVVRRCAVRGDPVVMAPHRDLLLITGSEDEDGLRQVAEKSLQALMAPRAMDGRALRLTSEGWVPFMPERLSNAWGGFRKLELYTQARDYDEQTKRLEKLYAERGEDVFVASYTPYQDEQGRSISYAVWLRGVDTLLPKADVIFFMDPALGEEAPPVAIARWDEVVKAIGYLVKKQVGLYPERYRVTGFPAEYQLAQWQNDPGELFDKDGP
jgi:hypothetical protein